MKAKDTVMTYEQTQVIVDELIAEEANADRVSLLRTEFEAQAEISFNLRTEDILKQLREFNQRGLTITEALDLLQ